MIHLPSALTAPASPSGAPAVVVMRRCTPLIHAAPWRAPTSVSCQPAMTLPSALHAFARDGDPGTVDPRSTSPAVDENR